MHAPTAARRKRVQRADGASTRQPAADARVTMISVMDREIQRSRRGSPRSPRFPAEKTGVERAERLVHRLAREMRDEPMDPLPIRKRLTILRDDSRRCSALVFCDPRRHSVPLSRCVACELGGPVMRDALGHEATVGCRRYTVPSTPSSIPPPPSGVRLAGSNVADTAATLPVGLALVRPVACVAFDAPLHLAARVLAAEPSAYGVSVVDAEDRLVGILPRATAALALLDSAADAVAEHMAVGWASIEEWQSLRAAFGAMAARGARELTVVGEGRAVVGILRDIDALRFVAHVSRTGLRPAVERAA